MKELGILRGARALQVEGTMSAKPGSGEGKEYRILQALVVWTMRQVCSMVYTSLSQT